MPRMYWRYVALILFVGVSILIIASRQLNQHTSDEQTIGLRRGGSRLPSLNGVLLPKRAYVPWEFDQAVAPFDFIELNSTNARRWDKSFNDTTVGNNTVCFNSYFHTIAVTPCESVAVGEEISVLTQSLDTNRNYALFCVFDFDPLPPVHLPLDAFRAMREEAVRIELNQSSSSTRTPLLHFAHPSTSNCERVSSATRATSAATLSPRQQLREIMPFYHFTAMRPSVVVRYPLWYDTKRRVTRCQVPSPPPQPTEDKQQATSKQRRVAVTVGMVTMNHRFGQKIWDGGSCYMRRPGFFSVAPTAADFLLYDPTVPISQLNDAEELPSSYINSLSGQKRSTPTQTTQANRSDTEEKRDVQDDVGEKKCFLGMCLMLHTENHDMVRQWIEYHRLHGIRHFFIYDHLNKQPLSQVLADYLPVDRQHADSDTTEKWEAYRREREAQGQGQNKEMPPAIVDIIDWSFPEKPQHAHMSHCLERYGARGVQDLTVRFEHRYHLYSSFPITQYKNYTSKLHTARAQARNAAQCEWLAFLDVDEYLLPNQDDQFDGSGASTYIQDFLGKHTLDDRSTYQPSQDADNADVALPVPEYFRTYEPPRLRYGHNGHVRRPKGLFLENYTTRKPNAEKFTKSIVQRRWHPSLENSVHDFATRDDERTPLPPCYRTQKFETSAMVINHYAVRSWHDAVERARLPRLYYKVWVNETILAAVERKFAEDEAKGLTPVWPTVKALDNAVLRPDTGQELLMLKDFITDVYNITDSQRAQRYHSALKHAMQFS